jgi:hypothetical protein
MTTIKYYFVSSRRSFPDSGDGPAQSLTALLYQQRGGTVSLFGGKSGSVNVTAQMIDRNHRGEVRAEKWHRALKYMTM